LDAEKSLAKALDKILPQVNQSFKNGQFTEALQAFATFPVSFTDAADGTDAVHVAASTFNANVSDAAAGEVTTAAVAAFLSNLSGAAVGADSVAAIAAFLANASDGAAGADSVLVEASEFSATVSDAAAGDDSVRALATMAASFTDAATIDDADTANFLWNIINDSQTTTWSVVKTQA
jgi:hypothetical protein